MVNLGAGMDLATGDRYEGVKNEGFIKKRNIRLMISITSIMIGIDLKCRVILTFENRIRLMLVE